jgi:toxin ParE1/3/4
MIDNYHDEAHAELVAAIEEHIKIDVQLGLDFVRAILNAEGQILVSPLSFPIVEDGPVDAEVRYRMLKRFKFRIIYQMESGKPRVIAFAHLRQRPGYWKHRIIR